MQGLEGRGRVVKQAILDEYNVFCNKNNKKREESIKLTSSLLIAGDGSDTSTCLSRDVTVLAFGGTVLVVFNSVDASNRVVVITALNLLGCDILDHVLVGFEHTSSKG